MTDQTDVSAEQARPLTYYDASSHYDVVTARERHEELNQREMDARLAARLRAEGKFDPERHEVLDKNPLTAAEHLELIATGSVLVNYYGHVTQLDHAIKGGATWDQIADARGTTAATVRAEYREWAESQHAMWAATWPWEGTEAGKRGMPDAEYAEALARAAEPADREAGS